MSYHDLTGIESDGTTVRHFRPSPDAAENIEGETGTVLDGTIELVDDADDGEKPLKSLRVDELRAKARELGVKPDIADGLVKNELVDVIERMTASRDD